MCVFGYEIGLSADVVCQNSVKRAVTKTALLTDKEMFYLRINL